MALITAQTQKYICFYYSLIEVYLMRFHSTSRGSKTYTSICVKSMTIHEKHKEQWKETERKTLAHKSYYHYADRTKKFKPSNWDFKIFAERIFHMIAMRQRILFRTLFVAYIFLAWWYLCPRRSCLEAISKTWRAERLKSHSRTEGYVAFKLAIFWWLHESWRFPSWWYNHVFMDQGRLCTTQYG